MAQCNSTQAVPCESDGHVDIFVANDAGVNYLYRGDGVGFLRMSLGAITSDISSSQSAAWGDYDNDNHLDLFVANFNDVNYLYRNDGSVRLV